MASIWKGHLTLGLLSFPVRLLTAARGDTVNFHQLHKKDHSRIRQVPFCQNEDQPISRNDIVKGYEYEKGRYVVIEDEDIQRIVPRSAKSIDILEFVKQDSIDPVYLENSFYLGPDEEGETGYTLLFEALKETGYCGIAKLTLHNREHIVVIRPGETGIVLHTMYYADEVRKEEQYHADRSVVNETQLRLAKLLIESLATDFEPQKYHDTYRETLQQMVQAKVEGKRLETAPQPKIATVTDIMEALKRSLESRKGPQTAMPAQHAHKSLKSA